jgi:hypothetical protein
MFGATSGINSYVGHTFEVQELPSKKGCLQKKCRKTHFTVSGDEDQGWLLPQEGYPAMISCLYYAPAHAPHSFFLACSIYHRKGLYGND